MLILLVLVSGAILFRPILMTYLIQPVATLEDLSAHKVHREKEHAHERNPGEAHSRYLPCRIRHVILLWPSQG